jgi:hypothetical protein
VANARSGWFCLFLSPRYRVEDDRVVISRSPFAWVTLAATIVALVIFKHYWDEGHTNQHFTQIWWSGAIAAFGAVGIVSATWLPGRVVITPGAVVWGGVRVPRAEIKELTATGLVSSMRGHVGSYSTLYLELKRTAGETLLMQLASTQFLQASTTQKVHEVVGAALKIFERPEAAATKPAPAPAPPAPVAPAPAPTPSPALLRGDVAAIAVGSRIYRVRPGFIDFDADVVAFEDGKEVAKGTVSLPHYFQLAQAKLSTRGTDLVIELVAFHCKDDSPFDGTWVVDAACKTQSKTWKND